VDRRERMIVACPTDADAVQSVLGGDGDTVERAVGGVVEVGLSPFPPYDPLMEPAFPPYLNSTGRKGDGKEKECETGPASETGCGSEAEECGDADAVASTQQ
jgi:hypothetical protein